MTDAMDRYKKADAAYQAWRNENPNVDPMKDPEGKRLAKERDDALPDTLAN